MKAMILAAGLGRRFMPLTQYTPKPLIKLNNKPLLEHNIEYLLKHNVNEIIINAHHHQDQILSFVRQSKYHSKLKVLVESDLLDTGGAICNALPYLGDEPFIVMSSDIHTEYPLEQLNLHKDKDAHLVLVNNPSFHPAGDFSISNDDLILPNKLTYTFSNISIYRKSFFEKSPSKVVPLKFFIDRAISDNLISASLFEGTWFNIGTKEMLQECEKQFSNQPQIP